MDQIVTVVKARVQITGFSVVIQFEKYNSARKDLPPPPSRGRIEVGELDDS
jgi:hypothetical protein